MAIRCPHCGSPVIIRGSRWECGWCGDFGSISSLHPSEKAKLLQSVSPTVQITVTVTDTSTDETPRKFSQSELEDMVHRWDFDENEWACRDLLIVSFPQAVSRWSEEELAEMHTMDILLEVCKHNPQAAIEMAKLLLNTAEPHLQDEDVAYQLLGWDMYDLLVNEEMLPLFVEELKYDDRLSHQLFQSAYVDRPQEEILSACCHLKEKDLQHKLLTILEDNPYPHEEIELNFEEE